MPSEIMIQKHIIYDKQSMNWMNLKAGYFVEVSIPNYDLSISSVALEWSVINYSMKHMQPHNSNIFSIRYNEEEPWYAGKRCAVWLKDHEFEPWNRSLKTN